MSLARIATCFAVLFAAVRIALATPPTSAEIEQFLKSEDRGELQAAFARIAKDAGAVDPLYLMAMSGKMRQAGQNEEAVFWFLAGQLRMRYLLSVAPDENRGLVLGSAMMAMGATIYAPFQNDMDRVAATIDRVLAWDKATPVDFSWLTNRKILPRDQWEAKFVPIREGLIKLKAEFLAMPKDECERIAKSMARVDFEKERAKLQAFWNSEHNRKRVEEGFSTATTTVTTDGIAFRTAKNYLSPFAFPDANDYKDQAIGFHLFVPDLSGYTRENWSDRLHPQMFQVNVLPNSKFSFVTTYSEKVAKAGPVLRETNELKIYVNPDANRCFPEEIAVGIQADGEPAYVVCRGQKSPYPSCSAYFYGQAKAYQIGMGLKPDQLPQWRDLVARVKSLVAAWQDAAR